METKKVKIIDTSYDEDKNLVLWDIEFINDKEKKLTLAIQADEAGFAVGVNSYLTPELIQELCDKIKGKELNLNIEAEIKDLPKMENLNADEMQKISRSLNNYPFYQLLGGEIDISMSYNVQDKTSEDG
ncbi:MAG: hypothetical protein ACOC56_00610 [Atribacterota bacterium]